jgi:integrase
MEDLIERYVSDHLPKKSRNPNRVADERRMLAEIGNELGYGRKVRDVHFGDIEAMHRRITESGRPVRANRIMAICSKMFSLSLRPAAGETKPWRDAVQGNPVARNHETAKERFFSTAELAALSDAFCASDAPGTAADCIRLIMLTGSRPGEAMNARWWEFDGEPGYWVKPSAHTKQREVHKAPLNPAALELLDKLRAKRDRPGSKKSPWVFPGQNRPNAPLKQIWSVWYRTRELATISLWVLRQCRRRRCRSSRQAWPRANCQRVSHRSGASRRETADWPPGRASLRSSPHLRVRRRRRRIEPRHHGKLLGHTQARTTQRYARLADDPLREATAKIGNMIAGAGKSTEIIKLRKGR